MHVNNYSKKESFKILPSQNNMKLPLPEDSYGVPGYTRMLPVWLPGFGCFAVLSFGIAFITFLAASRGEFRLLSAVICIAFVALGFFFIYRAASLHALWSAQNDILMKIITIKRNEYITTVFIPWCEQFKVAVSQENAAYLLNGEVAAVTIGSRSADAAVMFDGVNNSVIVEVVDSTEFENVPKLKTRREMSGRVWIVSGENSGPVRVRVDSFASFFNGRVAPKGFVDTSASGDGYVDGYDGGDSDGGDGGD